MYTGKLRMTDWIAIARTRAIVLLCLENVTVIVVRLYLYFGEATGNSSSLSHGVTIAVIIHAQNQ